MDDILEQLLYASQLGGGIATTRMGWDASANSALEPSTDELQASIHRTSSIPLLIGVDNKGFFPNTIQAPNAPPPSTMVFDTRQGHQYPQYLHSAASPWPSEGSPHAPHGSHRTPLNSYNGKRPREDSGLVSDLSNNIVGLLGEIPNNVAHNARSTDQISGDSTDMDGLPDLTCVAAVRAVKPRIRARRGQATDPHSIAERNRRERIAERMKALQELVPDSNKTDKASMLDEIIGYVKFLQMQVKCLSMCRLGGAAAVGPLLADLPMQVRDNKLGANLAQGITDAMPDSSHEGMAFAERQVAKLMDEDMSAAMQYLQSKGLCLMPISLATAISGTGAGTKPLVEVGSGKNANNIKQPLEVEADAMLAPAGAGRNEPRGGNADAVSPNVIYNSRGEDGGGT